MFRHPIRDVGSALDNKDIFMEDQFSDCSGGDVEAESGEQSSLWADASRTPPSNADEEPLTLSKEDGAGYFPGEPGMTLDNGEFRIVVKLGWGKHSSTWLVEHKG